MPITLTINDFTVRPVSATLYGRILKGKYEGPLQGGIFVVPGQPIPEPSDEKRLIESQRPYLIVAREQYDLDDERIYGPGKTPSGKTVNTGRCSLIRGGEATFERTFFSARDRRTYWNHISRHGLSVIMKNMKLNFSIPLEKLLEQGGGSPDLADILKYQFGNPDLEKNIPHRQ